MRKPVRIWGTTFRQELITWNRRVVSELTDLVKVVNPGGENNGRWTGCVGGCMMGLIEKGLRDLRFQPSQNVGRQCHPLKQGNLGVWARSWALLRIFVLKLMHGIEER